MNIVFWFNYECAFSSILAYCPLIQQQLLHIKICLFVATLTQLWNHRGIMANSLYSCNFGAYIDLSHKQPQIFYLQNYFFITLIFWIVNSFNNFHNNNIKNHSLTGVARKHKFNLFIRFQKSNFLRKYYLLSCRLYKKV